MQANSGQGWFALFRFYSPAVKQFDKSQVLGSLKKAL
jgi:hypothetical protein